MHVLILGHGRAMPGLLRALQPAVRLTVLCELTAVPRIRDLAPLARVVAVAPGARRDEWIALARGVHAAEPVDEVVAFGEWLQHEAAAIGADLQVRAHDPATVERVHDKAVMRRALAEAGVEAVRSASATDEDEARAALTHVGLPCVVKPAGGVGSRGVSRVAAPDDVATAYHRAAGADGSPAPVTVEEYLHGPQFSVELLTDAGTHRVLAVTRKYSDPATFVELGHVVPAPVTRREHDTITAHAVRVVETLGVARGATHTEVVLTPRGPRVIETHVRLGGDDIPRLVEDVTGVAPEDELARVVLGLPGGTPRGERAAASAIWFVATQVTGELVELRGLDDAAAAPGVVDVRPLVAVGTVLRGLLSSTDRVASVRATGADADEALERARAAADRIRVVVATAPAGPVPV